MQKDEPRQSNLRNAHIGGYHCAQL